jgi:hypothetical protein
MAKKTTIAEKFAAIIKEKNKSNAQNAQHVYAETRTLGVMTSVWAGWHGDKICEVAGAALEDANHHALAWVMFQAAKDKLPENLTVLINTEMRRWLDLPLEERL